MPLRAVGARAGAALLFGTLLATAVALPQSAVAGAAPPGNNGDIKIHSASTPQNANKNEPKPDCPFYIAFFNFDPNDEVDFVIHDGPPFPNNPSGTPEFSGSVTTDANGNARSADITLPDGEYKVYAVENGAVGQGSKQKRLTVECAGTQGSTPTPTPAATPTPTPDATVTPDGGPGTDPTPTVDDNVTPGGDEDDPTIGGVDTPAGDGSDDDGPAPVGGVDTGGGGPTAVTSVDVTVPLALTAATGLALAATGLRQRPTE
ncbi:hypothetical protein GCM10009547_20400 [Sporichthya brevicatena]|uniref:Uncharacterized protein n=1 Tax=Sporichthya brevicatena TaxID=171442 RepID=A0ABN1GS78_9ACTN